MASEKILAAKQQRVDELAEHFNGAITGVLVNYSGMSVENDTKLRAELRKANVFYSVKKNSIISRAAKAAGLEGLDQYLEGETAIALSKEDMIAPAKVIAKFAENNEKFTIKAGFIEGKVATAEEIESLAKLPSKEVLIAKFLGSMNAPISGFVNVLNGNLRGLVVALNAIAEKKSA